jgi:alkylation response protein AidB-like acyl-CoA dehydrogenase
MTTVAETFRTEVRAWLEANCPPEMRQPLRSEADVCWGGRRWKFASEAQRLWLERMGERGWTVPERPREYGGGGLSRDQARALREEMRALGCRSPLDSFGISMLGPALLKYGTHEQKLEHLPKIARGEIRWCQGYSEPGSGSDLASLQTKAVRDGDTYVLNGQKVWTSYADKADWMFILVRTDFEAPKHNGITFLLMDMTSPGVSVKPIKLISGYSPFCETFLSDVRVPVGNVVGQVNAGWTMAKALLGHERTMIADAFKERDEARKLIDLARRHLGDDGGKIADARMRDRITQIEMDQACLDLTLARSRDNMKAGHKPGPETSIFKYYGTELNMRRRELMVGICGPQGIGWEGPGFDEDELKMTRDWLRSRGNSIEGGTSEVQLNIIAKRVLGLPD